MLPVLIIFGAGMSIGIGCVVRGCYLAVKSSYKNLDAIIWCFVGAGIVQIISITISALLSHTNF